MARPLSRKGPREKPSGRTQSFRPLLGAHLLLAVWGAQLTSCPRNYLEDVGSPPFSPAPNLIKREPTRGLCRSTAPTTVPSPLQTPRFLLNRPGGVSQGAPPRCSLGDALLGPGQGSLPVLATAQHRPGPPRRQSGRSPGQATSLWPFLGKSRGMWNYFWFPPLGFRFHFLLRG